VGKEPIYSFASGQSSLPAEIRESVRADVEARRQGGLSVLELPFTCNEARAILHETEAGLRDLLGVPKDYEVLFLQGGAYAQFGILAMNLGGGSRVGAYVEAGHWSRRAVHEAGPWIRVHRAALGDGLRLPLPDKWEVPPQAAYCHYTSNESAEGLQFPSEPHGIGAPLMADMTADLLTRPLDVGKFGLLYASSQKNIGIAGVTVVIVAKSLVERCAKDIPAPFHYGQQARERSKVNTPPLFAIAVAGHVCRWLIADGGLDAAGARNAEKSRLLYSHIQRDGFYSSPIDPAFRSKVSVRFHLPTPQLEAKFLAQARDHGFLHLEGHSGVGGLRASLYNFVTLQAVEALSQFMKEFERANG